ncbi:MAG: sensor histidine kinase [Sediminibacterium sp.]|nr:sensor histidine kinase [Sediminibacterium sp.]
MYHFAKTIFRILFGRVARNVYFWAFIVINFLLNGTYAAFAGNKTSFIINVCITILLFASLQYLNTLWLLPRFVKQKKFKIYFILLFGSIVLFSCLFAAYNYYFDKYVTETNFSSFTFLALGSENLYSDIQRQLVYFWETVLIATVPVIIMTFLFSMGWFMNDYFEQQKRLDNALKEKVESELALIKHQISPHFLFNTLNNLYGLSLTKPNQLPDSLLRLSEILRYMIYDSKNNLLPFEKEKEVMEAYIQIEKLRLNTTGNMQFRIIADKDYTIPPLLWLPVLENVFKHGTRNIHQKPDVEFEFSIVKNQLTLYARNTCNEQVAAARHTIEEKDSGFGLNSLRKRLSIIYPGKHQISENTEKGLYEIRISIILNHLF